MLGPCDVLLVEDNADDAFFFRHALTQEGLQTRLVQVPHGELAKDFLLCRKPFDGRRGEALPQIVVTDLKMPFTNGFELVRWIRAEPSLKLLPIAVLTSSDEESDVRAAYVAGANTYLHKPQKTDHYRKLLKVLERFWTNPTSLPKGEFVRHVR